MLASFLIKFATRFIKLLNKNINIALFLFLLILLLIINIYYIKFLYFKKRFANKFFINMRKKVLV